MHVGFVLIAVFVGPLGEVLYLLTVREPLAGTHDQYIAPQWKKVKVIGSTFHCGAQDSAGMVGAEVITRLIRVPMVAEFGIEYAAGVLVGCLIFQELFTSCSTRGLLLAALALAIW